ncbi:hypothetical protein GOP47_0010837 [Adiantum capillus-veneris]|uniref:Uncharacterized protein n=1 Tax=Adiantum capillus-veneris TaxID=13818 RepID=A0A9D4ZJ40_ADICA|nr:hypothetical protein GOP47_0010837 [Adiantum capillus-veneris]
MAKFVDCLHVKVQDKVEMDGPCTYEEAPVAYVQSRTRKILKKQQAKQVLASPLVPRPIVGEELQVIRPFVDAHVVAADDERVETILCGPMRSQQLQRGVYQVPPDLLDQVTSEKQAVEKIAEVPKPMSFVEKAEMYSSYSSALDMDSTWETGSSFSRYETYDVMHVDKVVKAEHIAGEETFSAHQEVGKPSLLPCDGKAMLTEEECFNESNWGFNDPVVDVNDESQVLIAKAMARIQDMRGCVPAPVLLEEPTDEVLPMFASPCIQLFEGWFYEGLQDLLADKVTSAKQGILAYVLQTHDDDQSYIFYPSGSFITIGRVYGFPFDPRGFYDGRQ